MTEAWKVYIRGVQGRGEEVIKMLEDRGGSKHCQFDGEDPDNIYFITHEGNIFMKYSYTEMGKIIMDNYREIKLPEKWKDGDILKYTNYPGCYAVFKEYVSDDEFRFSMCFDNTSFTFNGIASVNPYSLATPSQVEEFHSLLHVIGYDWDAEKKQFVDWRWKPKEGEKYFFIFSRLSVGSTSNNGFESDKARIRCGNCFRTYGEAEAMAEKIKKLLKGE